MWLLAISPVPIDQERQAVRRIDKLGYGSIWRGEGLGGKEAFTHQSLLLAATERIVTGTGIANLWARHPATMQGGAATLGAAYPGRFVHGIGISHAPIVEASVEPRNTAHSEYVHSTSSQTSAARLPEPATRQRRQRLPAHHNQPRFQGRNTERSHRLLGRVCRRQLAADGDQTMRDLASCQPLHCRNVALTADNLEALTERISWRGSAE